MSNYSDYIEQIEKELREEIDNKHLQADIPEFPNAPLAFPEEAFRMEKVDGLNKAGSSEVHLQQSVFYTQCIKNEPVLFYREVTSYRKSIQGIVIFCKRMIRKLVRFLLEPMTEEINKNRIAVAAALEEVNKYLILQSGYEGIASLYSDEINRLKIENQLLSNRIDRLEITAKEQQKELQERKEGIGGIQ